MNTITMKKIAIASAVTLASLLMSAGMIQAATFASINTQLGVGSTEANVINLQTFLASDRNIYQDGRVTGYYGTLTRNAVMQFQLSYGIPMVGNVGPMTLSKINNVINAGYGIDVYAPTIYNVILQKTKNSATFSWATTEPAGGKVYYSATPLRMTEAVGNFSEPSITGGTATVAMNSQSSQNVSLSNLQPNTTYYYIIEVADGSGNVTVTPQASFTTNQ